MIFDNPRIEKIREQYTGKPLYEWPAILHLATHDELKNERQLFENVLMSVGEDCRKKWLNQLLSTRPDQHWGVWFEIMLFEWLKDCFLDKVKPIIYEHSPDFELDEEDVIIEIEATTHQISKIERERDKNHSRIFTYLEEITKPYGIFLDIEKLGTNIEKSDLLTNVEEWLDSEDQTSLLYEDGIGNRLWLRDKMNINSNYVTAMSMKDIVYDIEALKRVLKRKAVQHKSSLNPITPYVICVFLEATALSGNNAKEAVFGKTQQIIDRYLKKIVETRTDGSGILYHRGKVIFQHISGFLFFRARIDESLQRRVFETWYIENPYASVPIGTDLFPVDSKFVVVEKTAKYLMDWVPNESS